MKTKHLDLHLSSALRQNSQPVSSSGDKSTKDTDCSGVVHVNAVAVETAHGKH